MKPFMSYQQRDVRAILSALTRDPTQTSALTRKPTQTSALTRKKLPAKTKIAPVVDTAPSSKLRAEEKLTSPRQKRWSNSPLALVPL